LGEPAACVYRPPLRAAIVGLGRIVDLHVKSLAATCGIELVAGCDRDLAAAARFQAATGAAVYDDFDRMLAAEQPDVVTIATDNGSHAALTVRAARAGVRAVVCEKPMAVHMGDALRMVDVCRDCDVRLVINHQRRMGDVAVARAALASGLIGDVLELEGYCAGDFLSDGTHLVDSLLALAGDPGLATVTAGLDLSVKGKRYGHLVELGATARLETEDGLVMRFNTGSFARRHAYQEYRVTGSRGMLWRAGDRRTPNWFVADGQPGTHQLMFLKEGWFHAPVPVAHGGCWRPLADPLPDSQLAGARVYQQLLVALADGSAHPLDGARTLDVQTVINAVYAAGNNRAPVTCDEARRLASFPLS
jgi:UDP-N-acetyl-2-amino-2-deoxyglucuronate dehydrogenase